MKGFRLAPLAAALVLCTAPVNAQETAPFFEQVPAVLYETYGATTGQFGPYFEMLVEKYQTSESEIGWTIFRENAKVAYRVTVLPEGLTSLPPIQAARSQSSAEFTDAQWALWFQAWGTRHAAVYTAAPGLSVVPAGFSLDDARALPYHRTTVYHLEWDEAPAFRDALRKRAELDRAAGIDDFVFTVWNGNIGTETQTVMIRVLAASEEVDQGANREARRLARQPYLEEFRELVRAMNDAAWHVESHDQVRVGELSWSPPGQ